MSSRLLDSLRLQAQHLLKQQFSFSTLLWAGVLLRLVMLVYGEWQDATMQVKYTDVDYRVFTDAARFCLAGQSPYERATYRYTPLLALLLTPNIWLLNAFGKLLFVGGDLVVGYTTHRLLTLRGLDSAAATRWTALWMLNPFVATISTRGNAESLLGALVLLVLYLLARRRDVAAAVVFGIAVQLKFYPIIYALPFWCLLDDAYTGTRREPVRHLADQVRRFFSWPRIRFGLVSGGVFLALSAAMYALYGWDYLEHTYLYHVTRRDHRHNFSVWFYQMYITSYTEAGAPKLLAFLPQLLPIVVLGAGYAKDPAFALFAQTFAFVAFNKVCTSQYFMWYLCFLPLVLASTRLHLLWRGAAMFGAWVATQGAWLAYAYQLEFLGRNTFYELWLAGIAFFLANIWILVEFVRHHEYAPWFRNGHLNKVWGTDKTA
ncbi:GPI mannosyltransferase 1 [Thamnocephalis sphaerospora]|uniref:GPI mannosyltransferase 1 n=1 Tax=Thamnocephalis sphaerospora TaxID=78915 RepID=A0A4P9XMH1_9FUNG|nr:GPI mannosyltransferase 1 [Thamnocephalis sphaerospora]|eukprot:RKP06571.1 GPI mannosyltransferase 1 [Thamnocephalis sphaerospora]